MFGYLIALLLGGLGIAASGGSSGGSAGAANTEPAPTPPEDDDDTGGDTGIDPSEGTANQPLPDSAYNIGWAGLTAEEQLVVELVNRARMDPQAEVARLNEALADGIAPGAVQPLAVTAPLSAAARDQSEDMDDRNFFSHTNPDGDGPGARAIEAGNGSGFIGENIGWIGSSIAGDAQARAEAHHENLWESDGHQANLMRAGWSEIGLGYDHGDHQGLDHSTFVTELFGDQDQTFLTGVVIQDADGDDFYDLGEGQGGVRVTAYAGDDAFGTATWEAGGYALALPAGTYRVVFEGGDLDQPYETQVTIGDENVKLDVIEDGGAVLASLNAAPPMAAVAGGELAALPGADGEAAMAKPDLASVLVTCGIPADLAEQEARLRTEDLAEEDAGLFAMI